MSNHSTVTDFMNSWSSMDIDAIMAFFADDAEYVNIPIEPANVGKAAIRAIIEMFTSEADAVEFRVHHQAENADGVVMNERTDIFRLKDGGTIELPVMGVFELADGKITHWRDYFDLNQYMSQLPDQAS